MCSDGNAHDGDAPPLVLAVCAFLWRCAPADSVAGGCDCPAPSRPPPAWCKPINAVVVGKLRAHSKTCFAETLQFESSFISLISRS